ncbi:MAG: c-type cytochrome [Gemmatimonadetes bacterium]|nr:c-type cytochrome [Gemmatimonadota bacterium]
MRVLLNLRSGGWFKVLLSSRHITFSSLLLAASLPFVPTDLRAQVDGEVVYNRWCAGCHGEDGAGTGPAANTMLPRPRDFTLALYQVRTTATGGLPTDADMLKVINEGMPGTAMPGWEDVLSEGDRLALVDYLKTFSRFFQDDPPTPLDFGRATRETDEAIARGAEVYQTVECWRCHGQQGRGDGESAPTLNDDAGFPIVAADLTENWRFNGGGEVEEIYRVLRTGLDGTPMPTFSDIVDAGVITNEDLWSLAHYVRRLSPEDEPELQEVVVAELLTGVPLPQTVEDAVWQEAERFYIPLAGQIIIKPRWFNPRVDGVWVQAAHDGRELALLVSWGDPSESPDTLWADFGERVLTTMAPGDEGSASGSGAADQLVVQFPQELYEGQERPYFLQGDTRRPAYTWTWQSDVTGAFESIARGMGTAARQADAEQHVRATAQHADGQWKVLFVRPLDTGSEEDLAMTVGQAVPMAFQAWDGDNGESGNQGAVSSWYFLFLEQPTPIAVYVQPPVALALTLLFGLLVVRQARLGSGMVRELDASARRKRIARTRQLAGMGVGVIWLGMAFGSYQNSRAGWEAGHADLGFWWAIIGGLLAIAGLSALVGTWIHTRTSK